MRDIKFRCFNTSAKAMYPNDHFGIANTGDVLQLMTECEHYGKPFIVNNYGSMVFMQYTGLKDKNGVEIYEGDIVEFQAQPFADKVLGDIRWPEDSAGFYCYIVGGSKWAIYSPANQHYEVIGNIYENPDLLEEVDNA